jgi:UDP-N-acetylglucosamine acyltransferase
VSGAHIHPTAIIASGAELADDVQIEPYAIVGPSVRIGSGTRVGAHSVIAGRTTIGCENQIFHHASVGAVPQDLKYRGEDSELIIGDHNQIREFATLHIGTSGGGMVTRMGDHNLLMNYSHIAHDSRLGSYNIIANGAQLAGHVVVEDHVVVGALVGIHQFVKVGESAILGAGAMVSQDVPPYCNATGDRARLHGLNLVGLKRRDFSPEAVRNIKRAYRIVFHSGLKLADAIAQARQEMPASPEVQRFLVFIQASERGVCRE